MRKYPTDSRPATSETHQVVAEWYVYMVQCADGTVYTGVTTDLSRRISQHNGALAGGARYTRSRRPVVLVWSAACTSRSAAQKEELAVRRLSRQKKMALIEQYRVSSD